MNPTAIDELRRRLEDERESVVTQLRDMGIDPETGAPQSVSFEQGFADSGQATAEKARVLSMAEGLVDTLREIDAATGRIDAGTYGRCESCGAEIPLERLEARPVARLCLSCQQRLG